MQASVERKVSPLFLTVVYTDSTLLLLALEIPLITLYAQKYLDNLAVRLHICMRTTILKMIPVIYWYGVIEIFKDKKTSQ